MYKTSRPSINITEEFTTKNYEKIIEYANGVQEELIHNWHIKDNNKLEHIILMSRNMLNYWTDSIIKKRLWIALIRCGAWIGTLETIEKSIYEKSMDKWLQKRTIKRISSVKNLSEIMQLLEIKGIMTHGELVEELKLNHPSTLTEIMKKIAGLDLVTSSRSGKYSLYSLTDAGVRYAKLLRAEKNENQMLRTLIIEYGLQLNEATLDAYLRELGDEEEGVYLRKGQSFKVKVDDSEFQKVKLDMIFKSIPYSNENLYINVKSCKGPNKESMLFKKGVS